MTEGMTVESSEFSPGIWVVSAVGSIDARTAPEIQAPALEQVQAGNSVVLDLSGVDYTSSAGLRMLLLLYRHAQATSAGLVLAGLSEDVKSVMSATGFLDSFKLAGTVQEGVGLLS